MRPHPDRLATTLAQRQSLPPPPANELVCAPGPGSDDARVDQKLLAFRAERALAERATPAALARFAEIAGADLRAGTVQDGTARGIAVALEEVISLCLPAPGPSRAADFATGGAVDERKLKRRQDLLVASAGVRARFSRKHGILLVDRARAVHVEGAIAFEDRSDRGTLDGFVADEGERPRLFLPNFLRVVHYASDDSADELVLAGRLGRGPCGYPCRLRLLGRKSEAFLRLFIAIENRHGDHRLRLRWRGLPDDYPIGHAGTPGWESVRHACGVFRAATLVRACGRLLVGDRIVEVPGAQCFGWIEHAFAIGADVFRWD